MTAECVICSSTEVDIRDVDTDLGALCFEHARQLDARQIEDATVALLTRVAAIRGRRGRDFIRGLKFGELLDRLDARANDRREDKSIVHGLEVFVVEPEREGEMIQVRFPGGSNHSRTRDEAVFYAGYWYGRKKLRDAVVMLADRGERAQVVVEGVVPSE